MTTNEATVTVNNSKNVVTTKNGEIISENVSKSAKKALDKKETKTKKVSVKKEKVEKENKLNFLSTLNSLDKSVLLTSAGMQKENIYKNEVYADCITDTDKKVIRRKIRSWLDNFIASTIAAKTPAEIKKIKAQFDIFYFATYRINDYSLSSLISANTNQLKKENIQKMLDAFKKAK